MADREYIKSLYAQGMTKDQVRAEVFRSSVKSLYAQGMTKDQVRAEVSNWRTPDQHIDVTYEDAPKNPISRTTWGDKGASAIGKALYDEDLTPGQMVWGGLTATPASMAYHGITGAVSKAQEPESTITDIAKAVPENIGASLKWAVEDEAPEPKLLSDVYEKARRKSFELGSAAVGGTDEGYTESGPVERVLAELAGGVVGGMAMAPKTLAKVAGKRILPEFIEQGSLRGIGKRINQAIPGVTAKEGGEQLLYGGIPYEGSGVQKFIQGTRPPKNQGLVGKAYDNLKKMGQTREELMDESQMIATGKRLDIIEQDLSEARVAFTQSAPADRAAVGKTIQKLEQTRNNLTALSGHEAAEAIRESAMYAGKFTETMGTQFKFEKPVGFIGRLFGGKPVYGKILRENGLDTLIEDQVAKGVRRADAETDLSKKLFEAADGIRGYNKKTGKFNYGTSHIGFEDTADGLRLKDIEVRVGAGQAKARLEALQKQYGDKAVNFIKKYHDNTDDADWWTPHKLHETYNVKSKGEVVFEQITRKVKDIKTGNINRFVKQEQARAEKHIMYKAGQKNLPRDEAIALVNKERKKLFSEENTEILTKKAKEYARVMGEEDDIYTQVLNDTVENWADIAPTLDGGVGAKGFAEHLGKGIEGYVHHIADSSPQGLVMRVRSALAKVTAGGRKQRTRIESEVENIFESMYRNAADFGSESEINRSMGRVIDKITVPWRKGMHVPEGWSKITKTEVPEIAGFMGERVVIIPNEVKIGMVKTMQKVEVSGAMAAIGRGLIHYNRANLLIHPMSLVYNTMGGMGQASIKVMHDAILDIGESGGKLFSGDVKGLYGRTGNNIYSFAKAFGKEARTELPAYKLGSGLAGQMLGRELTQAGILERATKVYFDHLWTPIEHYFKRALILGEQRRIAQAAVREKGLVGEAAKKYVHLKMYKANRKDWHKAMRVMDSFAFDYANEPWRLKHFKESGSMTGVALQLLGPLYPTYGYKLARLYGKYNPVKNLSKDLLSPKAWAAPASKAANKDRIAKLLTTGALYGLYKGTQEGRDALIGEGGVGNYQEGMGGAVNKSGRELIYKDDEGIEYYLRVLKVPPVNIFKAVEGLAGMIYAGVAGNELDAAGFQQDVEALGQEFFSMGMGLDLADIMRGKAGKFEQYHSTTARLGHLLASQTPGTRLLQSARRLIDPVQRKPETFFQGVMNMTPLSGMGTGPIKWGGRPRYDSITHEPLTYDPLTEVAKMGGGNVKGIDPVVYKYAREKIEGTVEKRGKLYEQTKQKHDLTTDSQAKAVIERERREKMARRTANKLRRLRRSQEDLE